MSVTVIRRNESELTYLFNQSGLELCGIYKGQVELELKVDLFPYGFHESLKLAVANGTTAYPRISLPFGKKHRFTLERQGGLKNGEMWFTLKSTTSGFFVIELRAREIENFLAEMRSFMTRP